MKKVIGLLFGLFSLALFAVPAFAAVQAIPQFNAPQNQRDKYDTDLFTGSATYNYPLKLPKGTNDLTPNLSLSYNSMGRSDFSLNAGLGWQLNHDYIERDAKNTPWDTSDDIYKLHLSGSQYDVLYTPSDGTYHTKIESFLKIEHLGSYNAEYYNNQTLSGTPSLTRVDPSINFDWGGGSPDPAISTDHFSARWTKTATFAAGDYTFSATADDGVRVYVDDTLVIDHWLDEPPTTYTATQTISAGQHTIKIEYYDNAGGAVMQFNYQLASGGQVGDYWQVTTKDGTKYVFGNTADSTAVCNGQSYLSSWNLTQVTDVHNNNIYYTYTQSNGIVYLTKIAYNNDKARTVDVSYTPITYQRSEYVQGCLAKETQQLSFVQIKANGSLVHEYDFGLVPAQDTQPYLQTITEKGSDGSVLPATSFGYTGEASQNGSHINVSNGYNMDAELDHSDVGLCDMNGDGYPDLVKAVGDSPNVSWLVKRNNGSYFEQNWTTMAVIAPHMGVPGVAMTDVNGDGKCDIVQTVNVSGNNYNWFVWINTSSNGNLSFSGQQTWANNQNFDQSGGLADSSTALIDMNGDGLPDIVHVGNNNDWQVYPNVAGQNRWDPNPAHQTWVHGGPTFNSPSTRVVDLNGDGLPDVLETNNNGGPIETYKAYINTGSSLLPAVNWITSADVDGIDLSNSNVVIADVNGDGLPDVVRGTGFDATHTSAHWEYLQNMGDHFSTTRQTWFDATMDGNHDFNYVKVVDINGDGVPDVLAEVFGAWEGFISQGSAPHALSDITTSQGGKVHFDYTPSTRFPNGSNLPFAMWVVQKMTADNGMTNSQHTTDETDYDYANGLYDTTNKEFRGFANVHSVLSNGANKQYVFNQGDGTKGTLASVLTTDAAGNPYTKTEDTWSNSQNSGVYTVLLQSEKNYSYDGNANNPKIKETDYQYDVYGNQTKISDLGDTSMTGDERFTYNEYTYNPTAWIVDSVKHTYVNATNDTTKVSESLFYYDNHPNLDDAPTAGDVTKEVKWLSGGGNPVTSYSYDTYGNQTAVTDPNNHTTQTVYGTSDTTFTYPDKTINAKNQQTTYGYDLGTGNLLSTTDPNGYTTSYVYDVFGRINKEIKPYDSLTYPTTSYQYFDNVTPVGVLVSKRQTNGSSSTLDSYTFTDGLNRTIQTRTPAEDTASQIVADTFYTNNGQVDKQSVPHLDVLSTTYAAPVSGIKVIANQYDPINRITVVTNPDLTTKNFSYNHWVKTTTNENGHITKQYLNAYEKPIQVDEVTNIATYNTFYLYDTLQNLTRIVDAENNSTSFTYDTLGRKTMQNDPDLGVWRYGYDSAGNLIHQTDARGVTTIRNYDELNRLTKIDYPTDTDVVNTYDSPIIGTISTTTDGAGTISFAYDQRLRKTQQSRELDGNTWTTSFVYDSADRLSSQTNPDGEVVTYAFNPQGEIGSVSGIVSNIDYNAQDKITKKDFANGLTTNYSYDPNSFRLSRIQTTSNVASLQDLSYTYDGVGNVTGIANAVTAKNQSFTYDYLERLTSARETNGYTFAYAYDPIGNLTSVTSDSTLTNYTYGENAGVHAVTSSTDVPVTPVPTPTPTIAVSPTPTPTPMPNPAIFGSGSDGDITIASDTTQSPIDSQTSATAGSTTASVGSNLGFGAGQLVMFHQTQGANAGVWETDQVANYSGTTLTLTNPLTNSYSGQAQVLVVPQYRNVTVNSGVTWTAKAWNGVTGGVLAFVSNGTVTISGTINADGFSNSGTTVVNGGGFRSGAYSGINQQPGYQGEGVLGSGARDVAYANGNAGGAGDANSSGFAGAGGGANDITNATSGIASGASEGQHGLAAGTADLSTMVLGGGGGSGGGKDNSDGGLGGNGAGIIYVAGNNLTLTGNIASNGGNGNRGTVGAFEGGGGGGAGGSILLKGLNVAVGTNLITANGGNGGQGSSGVNGGHGGDGRIRIVYASTFAGTTVPSASSYQDTTLSGVAPTPTPTPGIMEQQNSVAGGNLTLLNPYTAIGQTFTASQNYNLSGVNLYIQKTPGLTGTMHVDLLNTSSGIPSIVIASSNSVDIASIPTNYTPFIFSFSSPVSLISGTQYAVQFVHDSGQSWDLNNYVIWGEDSTNPYSGGALYYKTTGGWQQDTTKDFAFQTLSGVLQTPTQTPTPTPSAIEPFGSGVDGDITLATDTTENPIDSVVTATAGSTTATVGSGLGFVANQIVLFHQTQGTNAGAWELAKVASYTGTTLTLTAPLAHSYGGQAQARVVPQYHNVTVNNGVTWSAKSWNGTTGGLFAFLANGTLTVNGTINATGKGFRGGTHIVGAHTLSPNTAGFSGEGNLGSQVMQVANNGGAGGGGGSNDTTTAGSRGAGAGAGYATAGTGGANGAVGPGGAGGTVLGSADLTTMFLGNGGGAGGSGHDYYLDGYGNDIGGDGGNGGGTIYVTGATINVGSTGRITANGATPPNSLGGFSTNGRGDGRGGGGGAGGSIFIKTQTGTMNTNDVTANGSIGGTSEYPTGVQTGGNGGDGRIHISYGVSLTGTTSPSANVFQDPALIPGMTPTIASLSASTISEGGRYTASGSFTDTDSTSWTATVDYGDGTGIQPLFLSNKTFSLNHIYLQNGTYTVTVSVTDDAAQTGTATTTVTVTNVVPSVSSIILTPSNPTINSQVAMSADFTDQGAQDTHTATWDFGDGSATVSGIVTENNGEGSVSGSHTYTTGGNFTVTLTVTDSDGGIGTKTATVFINVPPVANAGGPYTMNEGDTIVLSGSATDANGDAMTYAWDVNNDGTFDLAGQSAPFSGVDGPASQTVVFRACDTHNACSTDTTTIMVNNVVPVLGTLSVSPSVVQLGNSASVSVSFSDAGTADTHTATIDYGDGSALQNGSVTETSGSGSVSGSYTYTTNGTHTITVSVTDNNGGVGTQTAQVFVNTSPVANANGPYTTLEGTPVTLSGSGTDADGDTLSYSWDLNNDGVYEIAGASTSLSVLNGPTSVPVSFKACDTHGACAINSTTVTVTNANPQVGTIVVTPSILQVNSVASLSAPFTDAGIQDTHTATINYGDGTATVSGVVTEANGSGTVTGSHTYTTDGTYTITVQITDSDGGVGTQTKQVVVNAPPTAALSLSPQTVTAGVSMTANASSSVQGTNPLSTYTFNFGDGTTVGPQAGNSATHTYTSAGTYTVTVTVTDTIGLTGVTTQIETVAPVLTFSAVVVSSITRTTATVTWTTNAVGTSQVKYGTSSTNLNLSTTINNSLTISHSVGLSGLTRRTTYFYKVYSKNAAGTEYSSSTAQFTTSN